MFDVSRLLPAAQPIVHAVAQVYWQHTQPWFIGLVCFGSAAKGDFIAGASDLDLHLYLDDTAFTAYGTLPLDRCLAIQRDLATIDPAPFRYIDGGAERCLIPEGHVGPVPGAYQLIAGRLPVPEATAAQLRAQAQWELEALDPVPAFVSESLLKHGTGRGQLSLTVRILCQTVWPVLYQVLSLQHPDALAIWRLPKAQAIELLAPDQLLGHTIRAFNTAMRAYYPAEAVLEQALLTLVRGSEFLQAAKAWYTRTQATA